MRTHKVKGLIFLTAIILGFVLTGFFRASMSFTSPNTASQLDQTTTENLVFLNSTSPIIDGNLESFEGEWENATVYNTEFGLGNKALTIRVLANETHLFMGINYVSSIFIPVNTTIPIDEDFNNETHTWYAIVFDRNYDKIAGSELTPDDAIVINYREEGAQDAYINGTKLNSIVMDVDVTGIENSYAYVNGTFLDDFGKHIVTIEVVKELESDDEIGNDIDLHASEFIDFEMIVVENETAIYNRTLLGEREAFTGWKNIKLVTLHDYFSYVEDISDLDVLLYFSESEASSYDNISTSIVVFLKNYGANVTFMFDNLENDVTYRSLSQFNLLILVGSQPDLSADEVEAITLYVASGGSVYILADHASKNGNLNQLLSNFGMEVYSSYLYSTNIAVNSSIEIGVSEIESLPYMTGNNIFTDQIVEEILFTGTAINFTTDIGEGKFLYQEGDLYPIINLTGDYYIDTDDNGEFSVEDIALNNTIVQAGLELQRGGRLIVTSSADLLNGSYITERDNKIFFLRQIQWLMKLQNAINFENYVIEETSIIEGESISVSVAAHGDNETILTDLRAWVVVQELKSDRNNITLTMHEDNINFNGTITPEDVKANFVDVSIRLHLRGYGYNETELVEVFLEAIIGKPISIEVTATIIFVVSIGLAALGAFAVKKYKTPEVEE
ncbi:MAG: hypothetical protein KAS52_03695 [Candidatus Heimdallarchaeota archaeon]|nr:hypothetical protein [Candidatus Heimdallarchaeota archaeon]